MNIKRAARLILPLLTAIAAIAGLSVNAALSQAETPHALSGVVSLADWNKSSAFEITGEWEFYWGKALGDAQIARGDQPYTIVQAPGEWNYYETEFGELPGMGLATYRVRVTGAQPGQAYGVRVQNMASAYRLYADSALIAQNGTFGDGPDASASAYRPQLGRFKANAESFNIILQVSNNAYAVGGMWEPVIFGTYTQVAGLNGVLSGVNLFSYGGLVFICLFLLIFFAARRREREMLILAGIGALVIIRLMISGDMAVAALLPNMPISGFGWIDYLTLIWIQFLLLYFVYCAYGGLVRKWQIAALLAYCAAVSLCVAVLPFALIASAYALMNIILLCVIGFVTAQLARASWQGQSGAPALLGVMAFILLLTAYDIFAGDDSIGYYLLTATAIDYMALIIVQCSVVARRYNRSQKLEVTLLENQIRPHFIHNSLASIISISRSDPNRARELLTDFSGYLRGFYDYDPDDLIPLGQELELVRSYAALECARFGPRVQVHYEIESENLMLPPLILQPLVENAFIHGLREKESGGTVLVYARRTAKGKALIGVRDDGVGMMRPKAAAERGGVAIENINRRLSRLYRTQLKFTVPEGGGCEVCMEIPWKEQTRARIHC